MPKYDYSQKEKEIRAKWEAQKLYHPDLRSAKDPYYSLYMFPYPSAEGLHVGHAFSATGADVHARFMRMQGKDVIQPMGFDAFGIHSENYALKINDHPQKLIERTAKRFREQFDSLGLSYDWSHSVNTSSPDYYRWTQWIFIQLFKAGLAEKKKAEVNWCPSCLTVLADEQVLSGHCERCNSLVERRELEQWFFKITDYADRLLNNLEKIDWTPKVKLAQKNWIGKSEGMLIAFKLKAGGEIEIFTTKPETTDGVTFLVVSPEHKILTKAPNDEVKKYVQRYQNDKKLGVETLKKKQEWILV
jgi:leucyl-tRNA synthetase